MKIECASTIASVVVHGRGALVTRAVELPADLAADAEIDVANVTLFAEAGSARAALEGSERTVTAVRSSVVVPRGEIAPGPTLAKVRELGVRSERIASEIAALTERRERFDALTLAPGVRTIDGKRPRDALDARFGDALAMTQLLRARAADLDERLLALDLERRDVHRALEAARLEDRQTSLPQRVTHPTRTFTTRIKGSGAPGRLLLTYAVAAARWWPVYTLRIAKERAEWAFEAIVAQESGEDWSAVALALSSADLVFDARLPELASLRFGRAQPRRPVFRAAPEGVDDMFGPYLPSASRPSPTQTGTMQMYRGGSEPEPWTDGAVDEHEGGDDDEDTGADLLRERAATPMKKRSAPAPPPMPMPMPMPPPPKGAASFAMARRSATPAPAAAMQMMSFGALAEPASLGGAPGGGGGPRMDMAAEDELVPSAAWQDYDALVLAGPEDGARGRLVPQRSEAAGGIARAIAAVDRVAEPRFRDPRVTRGMFDQRYDAEGRADVPSDGRPHRVGVGRASAPVRLAWRTVPVESADVYREAALENPFGHALLGGPVDVYLDGSLLTTTAIDRIDRGGRLTVGMGIDERIKVARNVRVAEEAAGLLGGTIAVTHDVDIELSSTIGGPADVTVLERVPVTDDKQVEVKIVRVNPPADPYDQADKGAPVRGGLAFHVTVEPERKSRLSVTYRLAFPNKLDIVGGSRRG